ncbi:MULTISPECIES: CerR family C-terminal domain-containing protein [unclassified Microbacterium]|uniref:CerR family C-terminal domain-containing protein n=1 Tax=unclassified Microbacterium TaxID=2609290 RepID=UPI003647A13D
MSVQGSATPASSPARPTGDETRHALLATATIAFARDGFHAVSTRRIAQDAQINQALIGYHFGGKDGLYHAVLAQAAAEVGAIAAPLLDDIAEALARGRAEQVGAATADFATTMVAALLRPESADPMQLILREQQNPSTSFDALLDGFMDRLATTLTAAAARLHPEGSAQTHRLTALSVMGQVLIFRTAHAVALRQLDETDPAARIPTVQEHVRRAVIAILAAPA